MGLCSLQTTVLSVCWCEWAPDVAALTGRVPHNYSAMFYMAIIECNEGMHALAYLDVKYSCGFVGVASGQLLAMFLVVSVTGVATGAGFANSRSECSASVPDLTIVTPVGGATKEMLLNAAASIQWPCIKQWVLVYDTRTLHDIEPLFAHTSQVTEIFYHAEGVSGNAQRNRGLVQVETGLIYFLDDDNVMHPHFWDILPNMTSRGIITFDQLRSPRCDRFVSRKSYCHSDNHGEVLPGGNLVPGEIDTAMFVVDRQLIGETRFDPMNYSADGAFIIEIGDRFPNNHTYIPEVAAFYNFAKPPFSPI